MQQVKSRFKGTSAAGLTGHHPLKCTQLVHSHHRHTLGATVAALHPRKLQLVITKSQTANAQKHFEIIRIRLLNKNDTWTTLGRSLYDNVFHESSVKFST